MLYVRKVLVVIKSEEKNKPMNQGGRGWWEERRKNPAKINRGPGWEGVVGGEMKKSSENKPRRRFTNSSIRSRDLLFGNVISVPARL